MNRIIPMICFITGKTVFFTHIRITHGENKSMHWEMMLCNFECD
jgi:hypothetical protein